MVKNKHLFSHIANDLPASIVVFLVALPLCLGIAIASDAPPISGIIAGIVGGVVVGIISKSNLSVSGPAAGLTAIVASAIATLQSFEVFLAAVVIAGAIQILLGVLRAGLIGDFIPNAVIKGMLAAIGIILILKQFPHLIGYDADPIGDEEFIQYDGKNTFSEIFYAFHFITPMSVVIGTISLILLFIGDSAWLKKFYLFKILPPALFVVILGVLTNTFAGADLQLTGDKLIMIPVFDHLSDFYFKTPKPDWSGILENKQVFISAITLAIVATLESLLSIEAVDKLDPDKNITPANRELIAQGAGNMVSGFLGGLPMTSVIVRSSANIMSGAKTKLSAIIHGILLLLFVWLLPDILNKIPKASLAAILIFTGYKLAKVELFKEYYRKGWSQFLPFIITVAAIILTDLLIGIIIGCAVGLYFVIRSNFQSAILTVKDENRYLIRFRKDATFINKANLKRILEKIPSQSAVLIDPTRANFIDQDIIDIINDFIINAEHREIRVYIERKHGDERDLFNDPQKRKII
jgi:carbonic anhydrase